jgi:dihydroorotase
MREKILLRSPLDMHVHFREGSMAATVVPLTVQHFAGAVIMPNLVEPITSLERLQKYAAEIEPLCSNFAPYFTLFFRSYTHDELEQAKTKIIGVKLYPAGITTNSEAGTRSIKDEIATLRAMETLGIPLLVHGESDSFVMDREHDFLDTYRWLATTFPQLTIVMEHITTAAACELLDEYPNLYATITVHHLLTTLDDVAGGLMRPHLFCKPIPKRPSDRAKLLDLATSGHPKVMFGSDSAPHPQSAKECCGCAAGVFTAPIALALLAQIFDEHDALDKLQRFVSDNACTIYRITPPQKEIELLRESFSVPASYGPVIPMMAGTALGWTAQCLAPK